MALFSVDNIKITGISACVPQNTESNQNYTHLSEQERNLLIKTTGVETRRIAPEGATTLDLCYKSANQIIKKLNWQPEEIQVLIFVSQSPDYYLPATSVILQDKLGLNKNAMAFDINLGCSGYVYGLSVISSLMAQSGMKKGLLLAGDISSFSLNREDKSTYPLFGDAGTATALQFDREAATIDFNLQSDGSGYEAIIIPDGGVRNPMNSDSFKTEELDKGIKRSKRNLHLDGIEVFNFSLREVASNIKALMDYNKTDVGNYNYFIFHQANKLIIETVRKKLSLTQEKVPYSIDKYGNTSSASIPLTIVSELKKRIENNSTRIILSGFGVGLSWGSVALELDRVVCTDVIEYT